MAALELIMILTCQIQDIRSTNNDEKTADDITFKNVWKKNMQVRRQFMCANTPTIINSFYTDAAKGQRLVGNENKDEHRRPKKRKNNNKQNKKSNADEILSLRHEVGNRSRDEITFIITIIQQHDLYLVMNRVGWKSRVMINTYYSAVSIEICSVIIPISKHSSKNYNML
ncbi:hypothetical protein RFI_19374 [Reticulomyxa filosa]|uniref:Uncharacterized protein n=1 Tax=Reticulomyxa filosa TaxID=46433 RepID=X6MWC8_RETFI|nr:hypothetical protein RFI_19374 [Reticulomyxa filosa]|eukprot:ETO17926.1 hypothetical protein RFI_19374 [Reticulomyxa filosa]